MRLMGMAAVAALVFGLGIVAGTCMVTDPADPAQQRADVAYAAASGAGTARAATVPTGIAEANTAPAGAAQASAKDRAENKWRRLPACDAENRRLEAYATFRRDSNSPFDPKEAAVDVSTAQVRSGGMVPLTDDRGQESVQPPAVRGTIAENETSSDRPDPIQQVGFQQFAEAVAAADLRVDAEVSASGTNLPGTRPSETGPPDLRVPEIRTPDNGSDSAVVKKTIRRYFPDLDPATLQGWVETYRGMSVRDLEDLLREKQLMPSILPAGRYLSESTTDVDVLFSEHQATAVSVLKTATRRVQDNLLHLTTAGYRRLIVRTALTSAGPQVSVSDITLASARRDFTPGQVIISDNPLHLAIDGHSELMFRLEPGCLLTRCGEFERMGDGRLGLRTDAGEYFLSGDIEVPADIRRVTVTAAGEVQIPGANERPETVGRIQLAVVPDHSLLETSNGVFFRIPQEQQARLKMVGTEALVSGALEHANVVSETEWNLLRHLEGITEFMSARGK
ncbi:MAG: hypothetical protein RIK87_08870 [Fuerstiella sp.]